MAHIRRPSPGGMLAQSRSDGAEDEDREDWRRGDGDAQGRRWVRRPGCERASGSMSDVN